MGKMITLANGDEEFDGYLATPPEGTLHGALILIHEIWGLVDHIKNVADRFAAEGYLVLAPDILSHVGVTPSIGEELRTIMFSPDDAVRSAGQPRLREAFGPSRAPEFANWAVPALKKCVDFLEEQPGVGGHVAVAGFCFGGTYSFALAAADDRVRAAVPFYGQPPQSTDVTNITAPILAFYGDQDENLMKTLPTVTEAMSDAGVDFTPIVYEGTGHAFFNDTNPHTYNAGFAADAWKRSLEFIGDKI